MPTILLIRHGQGSFGTADYDVLSPLGVQQSKDAHAQHRARRPEGDAVLIAGSLRRQRDTAAPWTPDLARELRLDERWNEYDTEHILASYADQPVSLDVVDGREQLRPRRFQEVLDSALARWIDDRGAGDGSWSTFRRGALDALEDVRSSMGSGQTAVVFTSGGVIATCVAAILGVPDTTLVPLNRTAVNTGMTKIIAGRGGLSLLSYNSHDHLPPERVTFR